MLLGAECRTETLAWKRLERRSHQNVTDMNCSPSSHRSFLRLTCFCATTDKHNKQPKPGEESKSWPSAGNLWRELLSPIIVQHYNGLSSQNIVNIHCEYTFCIEIMCFYRAIYTPKVKVIL